MGNHWRTRNVSSTLLALAKAGWDANTYTEVVPADQRDYPAKDLYDEWATLQFGHEAADQLSRIFQKLDGSPLISEDVTNYPGNFPRASNWGIMGPGMIVPNKTPWFEVQKLYSFIDDYEKCMPLVTSPSDVEHYQYWLQTFYYAESLAKTGCLLGRMDTLATLVTNNQDISTRNNLAQELLLTRDSTVTAWKEMVTHLLQAVTTTGEMGTIANLEMHNMERMKYLVRYDSLISAAIGKPVPPVTLTKEYAGPSRIIVPTKRTLLSPDENLNLRIRILSSNKIESVTFYHKKIGATKFDATSVKKEGANVYNLQFLSKEINKENFEYYIKARLSNGEEIRYPEVKDKSLTVVVW